MRRLVLWSLVVMSLISVAAVVVGFTWNDRADDLCREEATRSAGGYSVTWEWAEFAYVCDYGAPGKRTRRVGITDVFDHPGPSRRH